MAICIKCEKFFNHHGFIPDSRGWCGPCARTWEMSLVHVGNFTIDPDELEKARQLYANTPGGYEAQRSAIMETIKLPFDEMSLYRANEIATRFWLVWFYHTDNWIEVDRLYQREQQERHRSTYPANYINLP